MAPKIVSTEGFRQPIDETFARPAVDLAPKQGENLQFSMRLDPPEPVPGKKTLLFVDVGPSEKLELYLGAWAHMLIESNDLVDTIHAHPSAADGGGRLQFDVFFPRAAIYRLWIQCQGLGKVNTVAFTVEVKGLMGSGF